jgi:hypothetical protein
MSSIVAFFIAERSAESQLAVYLSSGRPRHTRRSSVMTVVEGLVIRLRVKPQPAAVSLVAGQM